MRSNTQSEENSKEVFLTAKKHSGDENNVCKMGQNIIESIVTFLLKLKLHFKGSMDI